ncbi:disco-interacting protein 2 homolog C-like isoform X2 [Syngnathus typhle]|uniref:disco-interacting protein 2 homolog C-like isoform X2 n=1 Tax=Syngnathus typhle TaxID=161592 RepID=UPI002A6A1EA9|nr:disco-interacting protein 2 homolog C-like isoform X2 [Syngnathus typhle]
MSVAGVAASRWPSDITQKGYEKKRCQLIGAFLPQIPAADAAQERRPSLALRRRRLSGSRDERYRSDVHSEAVQAALAKHGQRKMAVPMPSKRRSLVARNSAYTPPDTSSGSEGEDSEEDHGVQEEDEGGHAAVAGALSLRPGSSAPDADSSTTTSSSSSASSGVTGRGRQAKGLAQHVRVSAHRLRLHQQHRKPEMPSAPPDVTSSTNNAATADEIQEEKKSGGGHRQTCKYGNAELMETGDGVPVSSRVSAKIQQLVNTLKRPKRPPLREFFVDDFEELLEAQQPDPDLPKAEGAQTEPAQGEELGAESLCLEAALQRWASVSPKAPCLTSVDANGKPFCQLTYGKLWSRSVKVAYNLSHKLGTKQEPLVRAGDRVALVFPNNDPGSFMTAFYGCLLADVVPVPVEVPLTRKDAGGQQIGFLLGSCGVSVALTSDLCHKGLPKSPTGDILHFKGWPKLLWMVTESNHLSKTPRDWLPRIRGPGADTAYIEYKTCKDGGVLGVTVSRAAMLTHCRALTQACTYTEAETIVNVLDFKKDVGLWHAVLTSVMNMLHVVSIPYALMKVNPLAWIQKVCQFKAKVACVKSRDMHWALVAHRDQRDINLASLRMLLVADGANPWSVSSCDAFLNVFRTKGLKSGIICPCAGSPEALSVAIRRPAKDTSEPPPRGVLSMYSLSHGVIRLDSDDKLAVLAVQDVGRVMPGAVMCAVKMDAVPQLCKSDEVGELCVRTVATGSSYYGLSGRTKNTFEVVPVTSAGTVVDDSPFTRTGLLGFVAASGLVYVAGKIDGLMAVGGRHHNADDIVATALAVEPMKFVYRGRIAVFSIEVLHDERIVVVAEQRPDSTEEDSFQWMSRVLQAIDGIHRVGVYCLVLVSPNTLPKSPLGGIHLCETKQLFLEGALHPSNVLMCPHTCVTNLPKPRQKQPGGRRTHVRTLGRASRGLRIFWLLAEIGPASVMLGNLVSGKRIAQASGRDLTQAEDSHQFLFLSEVLQWRAQSTPEHVLYTLLNSRGATASSVTCSQLHKKAEKVAAMLAERSHLRDGDHVALLYPPGMELIVSFYGCLYAGCVPVTVRPPHPRDVTTTLPTVKMIVEVSCSVCVLTTQVISKLLRSKEASAAVDSRTWPPILDTDDLPKKKAPLLYKPSNPDTLAYLDFSVSTTGMLAGVKMSHAATSALCRSIKLQCELYPSREVAICLDPYCGLGLVLWCLCSVYSGHRSILIPPCELESNASLWLWAVSQHKVRDTFCSYGVVDTSTRGLAMQTDALKSRGVDLSRVRTCVVVAEERPRTSLTRSFSKLFKDLGLQSRAVSTAFGCRVNMAVCLQGTSGPDPTTVFVDMRALRHDRVRLVEKGSPHSLPLMESGKILPGVRIIIANPETKGPMGESHLGEIWVQSSHNASGYMSVYGDEAPPSDHFASRLSFGDTHSQWSRTGYLGFLRRTQLTDANGERHDALYVVGALEEAMELRGMRYHPVDIETSVVRTHKSIAQCAVFTWSNLLVAVVELAASEQEALDLVPLVTNAVLEEHYLIVGVVVVADVGVVPINSRGEKQRMHLRDGFLADQLDPVYVAYNM